ncbi:MAG TPA: hypothetical protein VGF14_00535 [Alphaproteobacteria bacterium]
MTDSNPTTGNLFDTIAGMLDEWGYAGLQSDVMQIVFEQCEDKRDVTEEIDDDMTHLNYGPYKFVDEKTGICVVNHESYELLIIDPREKRVIQIYERPVHDMGSCYKGIILQYADPAKEHYVAENSDFGREVNKAIAALNSPVNNIFDQACAIVAVADDQPNHYAKIKKLIEENYENKKSLTGHYTNVQGNPETEAYYTDQKGVSAFISPNELHLFDMVQERGINITQYQNGAQSRWESMAFQFTNPQANDGVYLPKESHFFREGMELARKLGYVVT